MPFLLDPVLLYLLIVLDPTNLFNSACIPRISLLDYILRIKQHASCSDSCFILAFIYIDRLLQKSPKFRLTKLNVHRVVLASILAAIKFYDDQYYNNAFYSQVGGVSLAELNRLEHEFVFLIHFDLHVMPELYMQYAEQIEKHFWAEAMNVQLVKEEVGCDMKSVSEQGRIESFNTAPSNNELA